MLKHVFLIKNKHRVGYLIIKEQFNLEQSCKCKWI